MVKFFKEWLAQFWKASQAETLEILLLKLQAAIIRWNELHANQHHVFVNFLPSSPPMNPNYWMTNPKKLANSSQLIYSPSFFLFLIRFIRLIRRNGVNRELLKSFRE
jgi:hypothetical protein